jgi:hypothetical protein
MPFCDWQPLGLLPGEWVEVRSEPEILATLDEHGALEGLPFMPEMRAFCGRRLRVSARADRTVVEKLGVRRMTDTVHLEELRCDGAAHEGCCRACLLFWKERWLRRSTPVPAVATNTATTAVAPSAAPPRTPGLRILPTRLGGRCYCQATHLDRATLHQPLLDIRPDLRAPRSERLSPLVLAHSFGILVYDIVQRRRGGPEWNTLSGPCVGKTPSVSLQLEPGERVRVKRVPEILATLDGRGWNHGMEFSREMLGYCGREMVVLRRIERLIRDQGTRLVDVRHTVILEGAVYRALNRRAVPRREYMFWRECWLERV